MCLYGKQPITYLVTILHSFLSRANILQRVVTGLDDHGSESQHALSGLTS